MSKRISNKRVKQMICSICEKKLNNANLGHVYDFAYVNGNLGFWVDRVGPISLVYSLWAVPTRDLK